MMTMKQRKQTVARSVEIIVGCMNYRLFFAVVLVVETFVAMLSIILTG